MLETLPEAVVILVASVAAGCGAVCRLLLDGFVTALLTRPASPASASPRLTGSWRLPGRPGASARASASVRALPWGTLAVNFSGSLAIGVVAGLLTLDTADGAGALNHAALTADSWQFVAILGFISGYTTFSTASYQTVRLAQSGRWAAAFANGLGQLVVAVGAVGLGWASVWAITGSF